MQSATGTLDSPAPGNAVAASPPGRARERWVDSAKGLAIVMVVFLHATFNVGGSVPLWHWDQVTETLNTFRMPLFFFSAGLFATKALQKSFPRLLNDRVSRLAWLYLLWSTIGVLLLPFGDGPIWRQLISIPFLPYPGTWFIYGVAGYFVAAWLLRRLPPVVQIGLALALALAVHGGLVWPQTDELVKVSQYFVFYLLAVVAGASVRARVPGWSRATALWAAAAYAAAVAVATVLGVDARTAVWLLLGLLAVAAGCGIAVLISRSPSFDWLTWMGSKTLPIYLLHWYPLLIAQYLVSRIPSIPGPVTPFVIPGLVAFAIGVSLAVNHLTARVPGLYDRPRWLVRLGDSIVARRASRRVATDGTA